MTDRNGKKIEVGDRVQVAPRKGPVKSLVGIVASLHEGDVAIVEQVRCAAVYRCSRDELTKVEEASR